MRYKLLRLNYKKLTAKDRNLATNIIKSLNLSLRKQTPDCVFYYGFLISEQYQNSALKSKLKHTKQIHKSAIRNALV